MTDNIFEIETTAPAHVACAPQESGILLTDFAAAYPSVDHDWILSVIEKTELPDFISRFLRSVNNDSTTHVEFAGDNFLIARSISQGCPASGFLFAMAFDPIFRWLQEVVIPRNSDTLYFLQLVQCAFADDLAVATALAPAFHSVDHIVGHSLNCRKSCWVQYGTGERESLRTWISENCGEFREMEIARHAEYVGTMIGPDGRIHLWTAHPKKFIQHGCATSTSMRFLC